MNTVKETDNSITAAIRNRFLLNPDLQASPEWFKNSLFTNSLDCDLYYPKTEVADVCAGVSENGLSNLYLGPLSPSPTNLDPFNSGHMGEDCLSNLATAWSKKDNSFTNKPFVNDYNVFWPEYQCQCELTPNVDPSQYDVKIELSNNFKNLDELVIMINYTVPEDLPVTKAQQGHIHCYDVSNDLGFIVGNTFPVVEPGWQSEWVKNNFIFLDSGDFDATINNAQREETYYRFGISENTPQQEIWYQIRTPIKYFDQNLFVFDKCDEAAGGFDNSFYCQYHPRVCPSLIPRHYYITSQTSERKPYISYDLNQIYVQANLFNFLKVLKVK